MKLELNLKKCKVFSGQDTPPFTGAYSLLDKIIDAGTYAKTEARYTTELSKLQTERDQQDSTQSAFQKFLKIGIHVLENLPEIYQKSSIGVKREVVSLILPEKTALSKKESRTPKINEAVLLICATDKAFHKKETGQLFQNLELSRKVAPTGIEPVSKV